MENQNDDNNNNHEYDRDNNDHDHEEERSGIGGSRWNPTKEQIEMLEKIYSSEGVRTPSAEQIQQITARLRVYGHIEGKNVFYWFQNHKARQRQKQRHERLLAAANSSANNHNVNHIGRIICPPPHHHYFTNPSINALNLNARPPILSSPHSNYHYPYLPPPSVICSPYYQLPQPNPGFYNHSQQYYSSTPAAVGDHVHQEMKKRSKTITSKQVDHQTMPCGGDRVGVPHGSTLSGYCAAMMNSKSLNHNDHGNCMGMRTLDLFPVHPTGILEHKLDGIGSAIDSATNSCATSSSSDTNMNEIYGNHHQQNPQFFDFFSIGHA